MSPQRCQALFFAATTIIGIIVGIIGGLLGWCVAVVLIIGGPALYAYGCHLTKEQTLLEVTDVVVPPNHQDTPQSARAARDRSTSGRSV